MKSVMKMMTLDAVNKIVLISFFTYLTVGCLTAKPQSNNINDFSVFSECSDTQCIIYSSVSGQTEIFDDNPELHRINKINHKLYHIVYSCGNPCRSHVFVNDKKEQDWSHKLIAYNDICLIEFNIDMNNFTSRKIFSDKTKEILKLDANADDTVIPIWLYSQNSTFERNVFNVKIRQKDGSDKSYRIKNPCNLNR